MTCCSKCDAVQVPPVLGAIDCWNDTCECHEKSFTNNWVEAKVQEFTERPEFAQIKWFRKTIIEAIEVGESNRNHGIDFLEGIDAERSRILEAIPNYLKPDDANGDEYNMGYNGALKEMRLIISNKTV